MNLKNKIDKRRLLNRLIGLVISCAIIYFLFRSAGDIDLFAVSHEFSLSIFCISLLIYFSIKFTNTLRYYQLFKVSSKTKLFCILCYSNFVLGLLPFRLGELSYLSNLKRHEDVSYSEGASKLFAIRFSDYLTVSVIFLFSSFYLTNLHFNSSLINSLQWAVPSSFAILFILFIFMYLTISSTYVQNFKITQKYINPLAKEIKSLRKIGWPGTLNILLLSLTYWFLRNFMGFILLNYLGLKIALPIVIFVNSIILLISLLPIKSFAGFGVIEGTFIYFLIQLGYLYDVVLVKVLAFHIIVFITTLIYGLLGMISLRLFYSKFPRQ